MNRITYSVLKYLSILLIFLCPAFSFAADYYSKNNGNFSDVSNWGRNLDGSGTNPISSNITGGVENFIITSGKTITITSNVNIGSLTIQSGGKLLVNTTNNITITINQYLNITDSDGSIQDIIDFGSSNVLFKVVVGLNGGINSSIKHNPGINKTQQLILNGTSNTLYTFRSVGTGTSIVTYDRLGDQSVFNSDQYANLELLGSGTKTLNGPSNSIAEAIVNNKLTINGCKLQLGTLNFNYNGTENNLNLNNGWVFTNGTGTYSSNNTADNLRTFPVGDANNMWAISLTNIQNKKISVRFDDTPPPTIPNNGLGNWFITPSAQTSTTITFINADGSSKINSSSNIAMYSGTLWKIQPTTYDGSNNSYSNTNSISLPNSESIFSLFTCPTLTASPASLPDAIVGDQYKDSLYFNGGTSPYTLLTASSTLKGIYKLNTAKDKLLINFTPSTLQNNTLSFTIQDATGCQSDPLTFQIITKDVNTTWNGSTWSNGTPNAGKYAIIAAPFSIASGNFLVGKITVLTNQTLTITNGATITTDSVKNAGTINVACGGKIIANEFVGNAANVETPVISPTNPPSGISGQPYSQVFTVADATNYTLTLNNNSTTNSLPGGYSFNTSTNDNTLTFTQTGAKIIKFDLTYTNGACIVKQTQQIKIIDLPSPNLSILNIGTKTYGDAPFKVRSYSRSTGTITYAILSGYCASIKNDTITINCAGPSPQNVIVVQATQEAKGIYKSETTTETFLIKPATGRFFVLNNSFLVNQDKKITVYTRLDKSPTLTFDQLTGFSNATVTEFGGIVTPTQAGEFAVHISMAATNNYTAFDSTYIFNVTTKQIPPVAVSDSIVLEMGIDSTFNILDNDLGMTGEIAANKTDIDIENRGLQVKFYATELGNFVIDTLGNLTIIPFNGFVGSGRVGYTVTDQNGLTSEIAYIEVTITPPYVIPELKANNVMTPNNDNLNDALVVANTDLNKENSIIIMDEVGNEIYNASNYQNDWAGVTKKGDKVEPGIYYYIFTENNGSQRILYGYVQIVR